MKLGIGVVTYNRWPVLARTIEQVRRLTSEPCELVVADDGSTDGTAAMLRAAHIPVVTGPNRGIAWNKNRALFYLHQVRRCDAIILLEDDTAPQTMGWQRDWAEATRRWGHVNLAGAWFSGSFLGGAGTPDDPVVSVDVSGQCSGFSADALSFGGYMDPRFRGFGFEHVQHSHRLVRLGYGGEIRVVGSGEQVVYFLLRADLAMAHVTSHTNAAEVTRNRELLHATMWEQHFRAPWLDDGQMRAFRAEIAAAMA